MLARCSVLLEREAIACRPKERLEAPEHSDVLVEFGKNMRVPRVGFLRVLSARARLSRAMLSRICTNTKRKQCLDAHMIINAGQARARFECSRATQELRSGARPAGSLIQKRLSVKRSHRCM